MTRGNEPAFDPLGFSPDESTLRIRQRGRLPHWEADHATYFVTFRLADSLPQAALQRLLESRQPFVADAPADKAEGGAQKRRSAWRAMEEAIDCGHGACWLRRSEIADLVAHALRAYGGDRYALVAWCIMPNHVHAVFRPLGEWPLSRIVQTWKSYTSHRALRLLNIGGPFWQREYYDRLIRDEEELLRAVRYVLENPAKARLRDWPWVWSAFGTE